MSCLGALFQVTGVNLASSMPDCYTEAVFSGMALSGIIASAYNTVCVTVTRNEQQAAVLYFGTASLVLVFVTFAFYRLLKNPYFRSFQSNPYVLEQEVVYERSSRFEPFSFSDSMVHIADQYKSQRASVMSQGGAGRGSVTTVVESACQTPFCNLLHILAPEIVSIVNTMFTTMAKVVDTRRV